MKARRHGTDILLLYSPRSSSLYSVLSEKYYHYSFRMYKAKTIPNLSVVMECLLFKVTVK